MDKRIEKLGRLGCDIEGAMKRVLGDEDFYLECLAEVPTDESFDILTEALKNKDAKAAFDRAHALKGVFLNLGLTHMLCKVVELVEPLRDGNCEGLGSSNADLLKMRDELAEILVMQ